MGSPRPARHVPRPGARRAIAAAWSVPVAVAVLVGAACGGAPGAPAAAPSTAAAPLSAAAEQGRQLIAEQPCASCHRIPGFPSGGRSGPALDGFAEQPLVMGVLPNTAANVARWLVDPAAVVRGATMPDLGLTPAQAAAIAAYLETLR